MRALIKVRAHTVFFHITVLLFVRLYDILYPLFQDIPTPLTRRRRLRGGPRKEEETTTVMDLEEMTGDVGMDLTITTMQGVGVAEKELIKVVVGIDVSVERAGVRRAVGHPGMNENPGIFVYIF